MAIATFINDIILVKVEALFCFRWSKQLLQRMSHFDGIQGCSLKILQIFHQKESK